jgi:hypothetical protein
MQRWHKAVAHKAHDPPACLGWSGVVRITPITDLTTGIGERLWIPARYKNPNLREHAIRGLDSFDVRMPSILSGQSTSPTQSRAERAGERVSPAWTVVILSARSCMERESLPRVTAHTRRRPPRRLSVVLWSSVARASMVITSHTALVHQHVMAITTSPIVASWGT